MITVFLVLLGLSSSWANPTKFHPLSDAFINYLNSQKLTWKAGRNFHENIPLEQIKSLMGSLKNGTVKLPVVRHSGKASNLPESFNAIEKWPECADIIGNIRDQAACGSCWAFAAVEAMSDRICIFSNGARKISLSAEDLLDCCDTCGQGCYGGYDQSAWLYWKDTGIVSGEGFGSKTGCKAYSIPQCDHHVDGKYDSCGEIKKTPTCKKECDEGSNKKYEDDLNRGLDVYNLNFDEETIKYEIAYFGPVEASFDVFEDFLTYKSGVYQYTSGEGLGGHAVKILGWGTEDGTPYWLAANSWNEDWGDKGYFKILRGSNHLGIESSMCTGTPNVS